MTATAAVEEAAAPPASNKGRRNQWHGCMYSSVLPVAAGRTNRSESPEPGAPEKPLFLSSLACAAVWCEVIVLK